MRRRDFIALIGGVGAASWPFAVAAQQLTLPVIGFLHSASADPTAKLVKGFCKGLFDLGLCRRSKCEDRFSLGGWPE
jgi:hypothetical protein